MELLPSVPSVSSKMKVCTVIHYLTAMNQVGAAIEWKIKKVYDKVISQQMINRCRTMFLNSRTDLNDDVHAGWPSVTDKDTIYDGCWLLEQDAMVQICEIEKYFQDVTCNPLLLGTILSIIYDHLQNKKVCKRWVIKISTDNHKVNRLAAVAQFFTLYNTKAEDLFNEFLGK